jgi:hypothetical protein
MGRCKAPRRRRCGDIVEERQRRLSRRLSQMPVRRHAAEGCRLSAMQTPMLLFPAVNNPRAGSRM